MLYLVRVPVIDVPAGGSTSPEIILLDVCVLACLQARQLCVYLMYCVSDDPDHLLQAMQVCSTCMHCHWQAQQLLTQFCNLQNPQIEVRKPVVAHSPHIMISLLELIVFQIQLSI